MDERTLPPPPADQPGPEVCYRHPDVMTGVHCTRCGRPICPDCMNPAPVGHHCPTCVAEARREFRKGPGRRVAVTNARATSLTTLTLAAIGVMFIVQLVVGGPENLLDPNTFDLIDMGGAVPALIADGQWWRLLSSMFLHAGILHLLLNGWGLYLFGSVVELQTYGRLRYVVIFLVSGFIGSVASYALQGAGDLRGLVIPSVGASGAIFGLLGAVMIYAYRRRDTPVGRAYLNWAITIIVLNAVIGSQVAGIDIVAHIGGAVGGALCALVAEYGGRRREAGAWEWLGYAAIVAAGIIVTVQHTAVLRGSPQVQAALEFLRRVAGS
jgi:membrane associated rhomboid family serine protease